MDFPKGKLAIVTGAEQGAAYATLLAKAGADRAVMGACVISKGKPTRAIGEPVHAGIFLLSDEARFTDSAVRSVDGGQLVRL